MTCFDDRPEGSGAFRIAIMQKIAAVSKGAASLHGRVPRHLLHPLLVRVNGDPRNVSPTALEVDEEEHIVGPSLLQFPYFDHTTVAPEVAPSMAEALRQTDWAAVDREFKFGQGTLRELADRHGVSHCQRMGTYGF